MQRIPARLTFEHIVWLLRMHLCKGNEIFVSREPRRAFNLASFRRGTGEHSAVDSQADHKNRNFSARKIPEVVSCYTICCCFLCVLSETSFLRPAERIWGPFQEPLPPQTTPKLDFSRVSRSAHNPSLLRPSVIRVKERLGRLSVQQMEGEIGPRLERSFVRHFLLGNRKSFPAEIPPSSQS